MNKVMNKVIVAAVAGVLVGLGSTTVMAADAAAGKTKGGPDAAAGKTKSLSCAGCHGPDGMSPNPMWPNLAKQNADYTVKQLRDFRAGIRIDPMMQGMAMPLSDQDIDDLAAYYASL